MLLQSWQSAQSRLLSSSPLLCGCAGVGTGAAAAFIGWLLFPYALDRLVAQQVTLRPGSATRQAWLHSPTFDFNIFMFNVTNPGEVMDGAKPILKEIGPYCFKEVKAKRLLEDDSPSDTVSYQALTSWHWSQTEGACRGSTLTGDELITVPNLPLLAILLLAEKDLPLPAMALVNLALPGIFPRLRDVFVRARARDLLFDGVQFTCPSSGLLTPLVCSALRNSSLQSRSLQHLGGDLFAFSFFGKKNSSLEAVRVTVRRGGLVSADVGRVVALDGRDRLALWRGECNTLRGTDASVFPPFRTRDNGSLTVYSTDICRVISGVYEGEFEHRGVTGYGYSIGLGDAEHDPRDLCYCPSDTRCFKRGTLDSFKCQGAPVVTSLPHFYQASADYQRGVEGLSPHRDQHGMLVVLEPRSGVPLVVRKGIQLNVEVRPVRATPLTRRLRDTLTPIFWAQEHLELGGEHFARLESSLLRPARLVGLVTWSAIGLGATLCLVAAFLQVRSHRRNRVEVLSSEGEGRDPGLPDQPGHRYLVDREDGSSFLNNNPFVVELTDRKLGGKEIDNK